MKKQVCILVIAYFIQFTNSNVVNKRDTTSNINAAIDFLLWTAKTIITTGGFDPFPVPDMNKSFQKKFHKATLTGEFHTAKGTFQGLSSLERRGDAELTTTPNRMTIKFPFGLSSMKVYFGQYIAKFLSLQKSGTISINLAKNTIDLQISLVLDGGQCHTELDHVYISELSGFSVDITGLNEFRFIFTQLLPWVTDHFNKSIKIAVEKNLNKALAKALVKNDLCNKIPH